MPKNISRSRKKGAAALEQPVNLLDAVNQMGDEAYRTFTSWHLGARPPARRTCGCQLPLPLQSLVAQSNRMQSFLMATYMIALVVLVPTILWRIALAILHPA